MFGKFSFLNNLKYNLSFKSSIAFKPPRVNKNSLKFSLLSSSIEYEFFNSFIVFSIFFIWVSNELFLVIVNEFSFSCDLLFKIVLLLSDEILLLLLLLFIEVIFV